MANSFFAVVPRFRYLLRTHSSIPVIYKTSFCESRAPCCRCSRVPSHSLYNLGLRNYSDAVQANHPDADELFKAIELEVKSNDKSLLNSYEHFVSLAAKELTVNISKVWTPPRVIEKYSLLKSVHIYKKHFVQYETRTHYRTIQLKHLTGSTADTFLEYVERNLPEGVAMKVTKHKVEALPDYIKPPIQETVEQSAEEKLQT